MITAEEKNKINVDIRKSPRAKRLHIRLTKQGNIEVVVPLKISIAKAKDFLRQNESWVRSKLAERPEPTLIAEGTEIPVFGIPNTILYKEGKRNVLQKDNKIYVSGHRDDIKWNVMNFLYKLAGNELSSYVNEYSKILGMEYGKISIRDTSSRWGSCSYNGNLSFCWRIVMTPKPVIRYLAAHEVGHLVEKNHSKNFWNLVEKLHPTYKQHQIWLKQNSVKLHSIVL